MKKLLLWLLLLASFTADAQFIGGGPRKVSSAAPDLSGYAIKAANNLFSGKNTFSDSTTFSQTASFSAPWADYQAIFGQAGQGGRIRFVGSSSAGVLGFTSATGSGFQLLSSAGVSMTSTGSSSSSVVSATGASGVVQLTASGTTAGQIRFQTGSTESARNFTNGNWRFGSSGIDNGAKVQVEGTANIEGALTTQSILPDANNSRDIGSSSIRYRYIYANVLNGNGPLRIRSATDQPMYFQQSLDNNSMAGFFGTSGRMFVQAPGNAPTDNGTDQLQVTGSGFFSAGITTGAGIKSTTDATHDLGNYSSRWRSAFLESVLTGVSGRSFTIGQSSEASSTVFRMHANTGNITIQQPGAPAANRGYTFDVLGNMGLDGTLTIKDGTIMKTVGGSWDFGAALIRTGSGLVSEGVTNRFGAGAAETSAILTLNHTAKGFLPPRQTAAQRTAITSPAVGLIVYQTDGTEGLYVNTSAGWKLLQFAP
jgi:hypothetical protein